MRFFTLLYKTLTGKVSLPNFFFSSAASLSPEEEAAYEEAAIEDATSVRPSLHPFLRLQELMGALSFARYYSVADRIADLEGQILAVRLSRQEIDTALEQFERDLDQYPPVAASVVEWVRESLKPASDWDVQTPHCFPSETDRYEADSLASRIQDALDKGEAGRVNVGLYD